MTRKFKTEPVSARMMIKLTERAAMPHDDYSKQERAVRLLLHWWAVGHNPERNVTTCRECRGERSTREIVWINGAAHWRDMDCKACNGTGKAVKL